MAIVDWINKTNDFLDTNKYGKAFGGSALLPAIGSGVANAVLNPNGNHTGVGDTITTISSMMPGVGGLIGTGVGTLTNTLFGSNINQGFVDATENSIDNLNNYYSTATDTTSLMNDWNNAGFMSHVSKDDVGTEGWLSNAATNTTNRLNTSIDRANARAYNALFNTAQNINKNNAMYALATQRAYGGPLTMRYTGTMSPFGNQFNLGGELSHGGIFDDNFNTISNGGTHEENPYGGVPMGVDNQGIPNLVEEGEVIWDNYVFSNKLKVPSKVNKKYNLKDNSTFAEAIKKLTKESEEMPNDPITRRGIDAIASEFAEAQEIVRAKKGSDNRSNVFKEGGPFKDYIPKLTRAMDVFPKTVLPQLNYKRYTTLPPVNTTIDKVEPIKEDPLRKTAIGASGLAVLNDWLGGNDPDYSNFNIFENAIRRAYQPIQARRINQQMTYKPFDTERAINRMNANTAASLRTALDISGGNRSAALAGLNTIANNYNNSIGDLYAKADEVNLNNLARALEFNKSVEAYNAEQATKADMYNSELLGKQAGMYSQLASAKQRILEANRLEKMNNLTNFIQNLSALGRENTDRDTLRWLAQTGTIAYGPNGRFKGQ